MSDELVAVGWFVNLSNSTVIVSPSSRPATPPALAAVIDAMAGASAWSPQVPVSAGLAAVDAGDERSALVRPPPDLRVSTSVPTLVPANAALVLSAVSTVSTRVSWSVHDTAAYALPLEAKAQA